VRDPIGKALATNRRSETDAMLGLLWRLVRQRVASCASIHSVELIDRSDGNEASGSECESIVESDEGVGL
jgi:hypothetical protein